MAVSPGKKTDGVWVFSAQKYSHGCLEGKCVVSLVDIQQIHE